MHEAVNEVKRKLMFKIVMKSLWTNFRNYANGPLLNMHQVIDGLFAAEVGEIIKEYRCILGVVLDSTLKDLLTNTTIIAGCASGGATNVCR